MSELKLARLPDRTPAKIAITVSSDLNLALRQYADIYRSAYGKEESVAELIPFMLEAFLDSDRGFAKARKSGARTGASPSSEKSIRREAPTTAPGISKEN